jgi:hypothetical protein
LSFGVAGLYIYERTRKLLFRYVQINKTKLESKVDRQKGNKRMTLVDVIYIFSPLKKKLVQEKIQMII